MGTPLAAQPGCELEDWLQAERETHSCAAHSGLTLSPLLLHNWSIEIIVKERTNMMNISVIVGSTRQGRFSEKPAQWILQQLHMVYYDGV